MKNAEKVESFIRSVFEVYGLDYSQYFSTYTTDDEKVELPMVMDGKLDSPSGSGNPWRECGGSALHEQQKSCKVADQIPLYRSKAIL